MNRKPSASNVPKLEKVPTGIVGLDEITAGGLPKNRPTLICGPTGCGKTLLGIEFLVHGALEYNEPGVFLAFEETEEDLARNVASLGFDLPQLISRNKLRTDHIYLQRSEIEETGDYDLEGLFVRLAEAIDSIGAKRVVIDTIEVLFAGLSNHSVVRAEIRRLFGWLKQKQVTAIVTGERGDGLLTRYGLEEYVADCVIVLDHSISDQISTRRLRVVKYRGSIHGTNVYPFLIGERGISVLPVTSLKLDQKVTTERVSSGVARLDAMLGGKGYYRGSSVLISGPAGTGKTSLAAAFAASTCKHGGRCLFFTFEESAAQVMRNLRSIGIDLKPFVGKGTIRFHPVRGSSQGLESHLAQIHELVRTFRPDAIILDPVTNLIVAGSQAEVKSTLTRLADFLKEQQITSLFTSLISGAHDELESELAISSIMDTWLLLRNLENNGERNRGLYIMKSRGMAHSNQVREFILSDKGIDLLDVYTGGGTVLAGSARLAQMDREKSEAALYQQELESKQRQLRRKQAVAEAQISALSAEVESVLEELRQLSAAAGLRRDMASEARETIARSRMADARGGTNGARHGR